MTRKRGKLLHDYTTVGTQDSNVILTTTYSAIHETVCDALGAGGGHLSVQRNGKIQVVTRTGKSGDRRDGPRAVV